MRQLATIQKIADILPIDGADAIEKVKVKEWWCVAKKGEFEIGDPCVYFEIDSLLPLTNPAFSFLEKGSKPKKVDVGGVEHVGYRLKTIKLRNQLSQGLALPVSLLFTEPQEPASDVSEALGIVKYEIPLPAQLVGKGKGARPGFIPKTDEERVQNLGHLVEKHQASTFYVTEKLDGSSATFFRKDGVFGVCSRNLELLETDENTFWDVAKRYHLPDILPDGYCVQGELVGHGIQGNPLKQAGHDVYAYNVFNITEQKYLDFEEFVRFVEALGMKTVPILAKEFVLEKDVEGLLGYAAGNSVIAPYPREGIVLRPLKEAQETIAGTLQRFSFKVISNEYLLSE